MTIHERAMKMYEDIQKKKLREKEGIRQAAAHVHENFFKIRKRTGKNGWH